MADQRSTALYHPDYDRLTGLFVSCLEKDEFVQNFQISIWFLLIWFFYDWRFNFSRQMAVPFERPYNAFIQKGGLE
jgi:hypothetical protein